MNNQLSVMSVNDMMSMATTFAKSGLFESTKDAAQAFVKIQAGAEMGIKPFASMSGIHIIKGKPTIGAGLIAAQVKGSGKYDYKVVVMDEKICTLDFYQGKEKLGTSTFTIDQAKKAGTQNLDKFPANMLFARAISNGVKWFTPDVFMGPVYTPEEMNTTEDVGYTESGAHYEARYLVTPPEIPNTHIQPLPPCSDKHLVQALGKIATGEQGVIAKMQGLYALIPDQLTQLQTKQALVDGKKEVAV